MSARRHRMGIYRIASPSGNCYIGSSTDCERRRRQHFHELRSGHHHSGVLQAAWKKYSGSLRFEMIASVLRQEDLLPIEQIIMDELNPQYNACRRAACPSHDPAIVAKIKATQAASTRFQMARVANQKLAARAVSRPIVRLEDDMRFASGYEAARACGITSPDNLGTSIKNGTRCGGFHWRYADVETSLDDVLRAKTRYKPVRRESDGAVFAYTALAAAAVGCGRGVIEHAIRTGGNAKGSRWAYVYPQPQQVLAPAIAERCS